MRRAAKTQPLIQHHPGIRGDVEHLVGAGQRFGVVFLAVLGQSVQLLEQGWRQHGGPQPWRRAKSTMKLARVFTPSSGMAL